MIVHRDRGFCILRCENFNCSRMITDSEFDNADLPVSFSNFRDGEHGCGGQYIKPKDGDESHIKVNQF